MSSSTTNSWSVSAGKPLRPPLATNASPAFGQPQSEAVAFYDALLPQQPFFSTTAAAKALQVLGIDARMIRRWAVLYDIGRKVGPKLWKIDRQKFLAYLVENDSND